MLVIEGNQQYILNRSKKLSVEVKTTLRPNTRTSEKQI